MMRLRKLGLGIAGLAGCLVIAMPVTAGDRTLDGSALLTADNRRQERREDRQEDRDTRQDCRQEEGRVGDDKRDCKQDSRDGDDNEDDDDA